MGVKKHKAFLNVDDYRQTDDDNKAFSWCIEHGIKIGMLACAPGFDNIVWKIRIIANNKEMISPREYKKHEILPKIYELYRHYYNKRK